MDPQKLSAWAKEYQSRRAEGEPGWTTPDSYQHKQQVLEEALACNPVPAGGRFLELGCGAGNVTQWMATKGFHSHGIDIVPAAIEWARSRETGESNVAPAFHLGNITNMNEFPEGIFDIVFDGDCLHMVMGTERPRSFAEIRRVLKTGGLFVAGGNVRDESYRVQTEPVIGKTGFDASTHIIWRDGRQEYLLQSERELASEIEAAGFEIARTLRWPKRGRSAFVLDCVAFHAIAR